MRHQVTPILQRQKNGVVHVGKHGKRLVAIFPVGECCLHMHAGDIEALVIQRPVFCRRLLPRHGLDERIVDAVARGAARIGILGMGAKGERHRHRRCGQEPVDSLHHVTPHKSPRTSGFGGILAEKGYVSVTR